MNWFTLWVIDWWGCFLFWLFIASLVGGVVAILRMIPDFKSDSCLDDPEELKKFNRNSIILLSLSIAIWVFLVFAPSTGTLMYWFGMDQGQVWRILHPYRF